MWSTLARLGALLFLTAKALPSLYAVCPWRQWRLWCAQSLYIHMEVIFLWHVSQERLPGRLDCILYFCVHPWFTTYKQSASKYFASSQIVSTSKGMTWIFKRQPKSVCQSLCFFVFFVTAFPALWGAEASPSCLGKKLLLHLGQVALDRNHQHSHSHLHTLSKCQLELAISLM